MSDTTNKIERGLAAYREVMGGDATPPQDAYQEATIGHLFGEVWTRPGLSRKERRWITLTIAGMTGNTLAIQGHVKAALQSGDISPAEALEWVLHFAHYGGWPLSTALYMAVRQATAEVEATRT